MNQRILIFLAVCAAAAVSSAAELHTVAGVRALPEAAEQSGAPVRVRGVLTYHEPDHRMAFLQDATGAIYVHTPKDQDVSVGDLVEVEGFVDPGVKGRHIRGQDFDTSPVIRSLGRGEWPQPVNLPDLSGLVRHEGARVVSVKVKIASVTRSGDRIRLVAEANPEQQIFIAGNRRPHSLPGHLAGMEVTLQGILADTIISKDPAILKRQLLVPGLQFVSIAEAELTRRMTAKEVPLWHVRWLQERMPEDETVSVAGTVTWACRGEGFFVQVGPDSLWITAATPQTPAPGQVVRCTGRPSTHYGAGYLDTAVWAPQSSGLAAPAAAPLAGDFSRVDMHGDLVRIKGELVEFRAGPDEHLILLAAGPQLIFAHIPAGNSHPELEPGARGARGAQFALTGVLLNRNPPLAVNSATDAGLHLLLRDAADISLTAPAPFWTVRKALLALSVMLLALVIAGGRALFLQRRVRRQQEELAQTAARRAIEEERLRLAREWHDTMEQHFAGLTLILDAAGSLLPPSSPASRMLGTAAAMTSRSREQTREAIHDLRRADTAAELPFPELLRNTLTDDWPEDTLCQLSFTASDATVLPVSQASHLLRIAQEAVTNAVKHSGSRKVSVTWGREEDHLVLGIRDHGAGLPPGATLPTHIGGALGVQGMRERAARAGASFSLLSPPPGQATGTLVRIALPVTPTTR